MRYGILLRFALLKRKKRKNIRFFEENGTAYIVMEYLEGETLSEYLKREGTVPEDKAVEMLMPVMESLMTVHEEGLIHRDIAPDNIFLTKDGEVIFNEINTMPGFTAISMYPMLWGAKGIDKPALITRLLELAHVREINL